jgi:hypothetical protein
MTSELPPEYDDRPLEAARAISQILSYQLSDLSAQPEVLSREEAAASLGFINALIEVLELGHAKPN